MGFILIVSIVIRLVAIGWSIVLLRRTRDWRMGFLTCMLGVMAMRQILTLLTAQGSETFSFTGRWAVELPGLVVSIMAFLAVFFLERMVAGRKQAEEHIQHLRRGVQARRDVTELILREKDRERLLKGACEILVQTRDYRLAWIGLIEEGSKAVLPSAQAGFEEGYLKSLEMTWDDSEAGEGPAGMAIKTGEPFVMRDITGDPRYEPWREEALKRGYASSAAIPLAYEDGIFGVLNVYTVLPDAFDEEEIGLLIEVGRDIALAVKAVDMEEETRKTKEFLQSIIDNTSDLVCTVDLEGNFLSINRAVTEQMGYEEEELIGRPKTKLAADPELFLNIFREVLERGRLSNLEVPFRRKDGTIADILYSVTLLKDKDDHPVAVAGFGKDITERNLAEALRRKSAKLVRNVLDNLGPYMLVGVLKPDGTLIEANKPALDVAGLKPEDVLGKPFEETYWWSYSEEVKQQLHDAIRRAARGETCRYDVALRVGENRFITIDFCLPPLVDEAGEITYLIPSGTDITDRKLAEESLKRSEASLAEAQRIAHLGNWDWDLATDRLNWSDEVYRIFGLCPQEFGATYSAFLNAVHPDDRERLKEAVNNALADPNVTYNIEHRVVRSDGSERIGHELGEVVRDAAGRPVRMVGTIQDITERKGVEEELRRYREHLEELVKERTEELAVAKERAEAADRLKSVFLATMSHELRTPLNSIIGFTGVMLQGMVGPLNDEQAKQLGMVRNSGRHLLDLINDVLDISKIEAGQMEIVLGRFDMREVIDEAVRTVSPLADRKGLELVAEVDPQVSQITSDRRRVKQILINLLNNAVKFTEEGNVYVECQVTGDSLVTRVKDTGIGIKPEDMDKLFEVFHQVDTGLTREHEGTGLGLAICKKLMEMLGGTIRAESEWGLGSTFSFTLPMNMRGGDEDQNPCDRR